MRSKKAIYNIITNLFLQLIIVIYGFIVPKIIISNYGSNVNGLVSSITQFLSYISLIEAGFGGVVQFLLYKPIAKGDREKINDILASSQKFFIKVSLIFIAYIIALCILYPIIINSNFDSIYTMLLIIIISISIFAEYYIGLVYKVYLLADQKRYIISLFSIITYVLNIIFIIILSKFNVSIHILKLVSAILFTLRPILQQIYVKRIYKNIDLKTGNKNYQIKQKYDALVQHIASVIHSSTDVTILSLFCKISEVSVYSVYSIIVLGVRKIISIFYDGLNSTFGDMLARNETERLKNRFNAIETVYSMITTIVFSTTIIMILPFVKIYTNGIIDANYIRPLFAVLLVISEYIWSIRLPYSSLTIAAGHYKETKKGAILECVINIVVSIALVHKFGLIGVAIGTIIAMFVRTVEFAYHTSKYILKRNLSTCSKKISLVIINTLIIVLFSRYLPLIENTGYFNWCINSLIVFGSATIIALSINLIFYKNDLKEVVNIFKKVVKERNK